MPTTEFPFEWLEFALPDERLRGPLLRLNRLQHGDVLLTRATGFEAWLIRLFSGSLYDHAGLFLLRRNTSGQDSLELLEADDSGVGACRPQSFVVTYSDGLTELVMSIPPNIKKLSVYRHQGHDKKLAYHCAIAEDLIRKESRKHYSYYKRLSGAMRCPAWMKKIFGKLLEKLDHSKRVAGMFCSELVATYFEMANIQLFENTRLPLETSPSNLAISILEDITNIVTIDNLSDIICAKSELPVVFNDLYTRKFVNMEAKMTDRLQSIDDFNNKMMAQLQKITTEAKTLTHRTKGK